jgi:septal ring factor EnvC (AmiA/AmiB activator)
LVKSLQKELKDVKRQLETKDNELAEAQEEMSTLKENSKEREKSLKAKLKDAVAEKDRLSGVEVSVEMASRETVLTSVPGGSEHAAEDRAIIQNGGVVSQEIKA